MGRSDECPQEAPGPTAPSGAQCWPSHMYGPSARTDKWTQENATPRSGGHGTGARHRGHTRAEQAHLDQEDGIGHQCHPDGATEVFWRFILHLCRSSPPVGFDRMIVRRLRRIVFVFVFVRKWRHDAIFSRKNRRAAWLDSAQCVFFNPLCLPQPLLSPVVKCGKVQVSQSLPNQSKSSS